MSTQAATSSNNPFGSIVDLLGGVNEVAGQVVDFVDIYRGNDGGNVTRRPGSAGAGQDAGPAGGNDPSGVWRQTQQVVSQVPPAVWIGGGVAFLGLLAIVALKK